MALLDESLLLVTAALVLSILLLVYLYFQDNSGTGKNDVLQMQSQLCCLVTSRTVHYKRKVRANSWGRYTMKVLVNPSLVFTFISGMYEKYVFYNI